MYDVEIPCCTKIEEIPNSKCYYALYNNIPAVVKKYSNYMSFQKDLKVHRILDDNSSLLSQILFYSFPYIIYERIQGMTVAQNPHILEDMQKYSILTNAVKTVHTYVYDDITNETICMEKDMQQRYNNISTCLLNNSQKKVLYLLEYLSCQKPKQICFIHGDLDASNVMFINNRVVLVDWEKSRMSDISWDFSSLLLWGIVFNRSFFHYMVRYIIDNEGSDVLWCSIYKAILNICEKVGLPSLQNKRIVDRMLGRTFFLCVQTIREYSDIGVIEI